jgi:hypothetical protein
MCQIENLEQVYQKCLLVAPRESFPSALPLCNLCIGGLRSFMIQKGWALIGSVRTLQKMYTTSIDSEFSIPLPVVVFTTGRSG